MKQVIDVAGYSSATAKNYISELRYLFAYYNDVHCDDIGEKEILNYISYIKETFLVGKAKCRMAAQAFSFYYKHVLKKEYELPSKLYPKRDHIFPKVMSQQEVMQLMSVITNLKHRAIVGLLYGSGLRLNELRQLHISDIQTKDVESPRVYVNKGKGNRDRFTLLPQCLLNDLREYYKKYMPVNYLFNGHKKGHPMNGRSIQHAVSQCLNKCGLREKAYSVHTFRHSFATHALDNGNDIHTIKELLGHSSLSTTIVYLHLQQTKRACLQSPLDVLMKHKTENVVQ